MVHLVEAKIKPLLKRTPYANKKRISEYNKAVSERRTCVVSYKDFEGVTHTVEVLASTLFEAAVLGMKAFEQTGWADHPVGCMDVVVKSPAVKHTVPVVSVTNWLRSAGSPREVAQKARLRAILGWND